MQPGTLRSLLLNKSQLEARPEIAWTQSEHKVHVYIYMCVTPVFYTRIYNLINIYSLCVTFLGEMIYNILGKKNMCIATLQLLEMNLEIPNDLGKNSNDFGEKSILTT